MDDPVSSTPPPGPTAPPGPMAATPSVGAPQTCPVCGAEREPEASFCEGCGHDYTGLAAPAPTPPGSPGARSAAGLPARLPSSRPDGLPDGLPDHPLGGDPAAPMIGAGPAYPPGAETQTRTTPVRPQTAAAGDESPLDLGWTGPVAGRGTALEIDPVEPGCTQCGQGRFLDGYCDHCGAKAPDPRDRFVETPAEWLAGVCDIGRRKRRNEDAMALLASTRPLAQGVLVVCDGVSNATDSHIASLAAARAAREVLDDPVPRAMGLPDALRAAIERRLGEAVLAARRAVVEATADPTGATPPSCTFVAALVDDGLAVVGNVGDSRAYWLPDAPESPAMQLGQDDSFAAEQMREGMPRKEAETGADAHAITRWLGVDSPEDLTPHTAAVRLAEDGWLLLCSDGLWNYCSDPQDLRALVGRTVAALGDRGRSPLALAEALVAFAHEAGGHDNITVALARVGAHDPPAADAHAADAQASDAQAAADLASTPAPAPATSPDGEAAPDGNVHH